MRKAILLGIPILFICSVSPVSAQSIFVVDRLTDTGEGAGLNGDLRYCITNATSGLDTITFGVTGTINLTRALPDLATSVTIAGPGAYQLTVRRDTGGDYRIFTLTGTPTVVISGLTIANGQAPMGGGIYVGGGTVSVRNTTLSNNVAFAVSRPGLGGGIYVAGGTVSVDNTTLSNNFALGAAGVDTSGSPGLGGGIYVAGGAVSVNNSTLASNLAVGGFGGSINFFGVIIGLPGGSGEGGGIYVAGGTVKVFQNTLSANQSGGGAGGCGDFNGDGGDGLGGGLSISGGTVKVQLSTLSTNQSAGGAGDIECIPLSTNQSTGGALASSDAVGLRATRPGNPGQGRGGGLTFTTGTLQTRNTILAGNTATTTAPDVSGNLGSLGHNLIGKSAGGSGFDATDLLDVDPQLGPLQNNGGPTFTHALLFGSPAIDAGDNTGAPEWDQRGPGFPRIDIGTGLIDIGAFEVQ